MKIGFIGLGNMAGTICQGLIKSDFIDGSEVYGYDINSQQLMMFEQDFGIHVCSSEQDVVKNCDYLVMGVKPNVVESVISKIKSQGVCSALLEVCFIDNSNDIEIYQKNKNKLATAVAKGIATGFNLKYISDKNSPHSTDVSEKAKDAIDWCSKYNILPPDIISDMDDQKILLCIGLYNTVKFLAEHI